MDYGDLDVDSGYFAESGYLVESGYLAADYGSQHYSHAARMITVITTWRSESNSLFLSLLPYSGATDN